MENKMETITMGYFRSNQVQSPSGVLGPGCQGFIFFGFAAGPRKLAFVFEVKQKPCHTPPPPRTVESHQPPRE